mmetsp:Transcript_3466/g.7580  ORF Transcript_3466/g.7580 Transcript_3466/m.7580 type:complete len:750 (-) Transcript_3466:55-2304(-)
MITITIMMLLRAVIATSVFPIVVVNSEPSLRGGDIGNADDHLTVVVAAADSAAAAENERFYESVRKSYLEEGCEQFWGEFPSRTAAAAAIEYDPDSGSTNNDIEINVIPLSRRRRIDETMSMPNNPTHGMTCTCGMLYDLGESAIKEYIREGGFAATTATTPNNDIDNDIEIVGSTSTQTTIVSETKCVNGFAGKFPCNNVDLMVFLPRMDIPLPDTNFPPNLANDVWGWTSSNNREFVIWGIAEGVIFVEIFDDPSNPLFIWGYLPTTPSTVRYIWQRDIKVVGDYAYVGSEADDHGIQIFDMKRLLNINSASDCMVNSQYCKVFEADVVYKGGNGFAVGRTHNIVANEETNFLYLVGGMNGCQGGLHVVDVSNPLIPQFVACFGKDGYVHDAQCVIYKGPDQNYNGKEICFCFNESRVTIVDVSDKSNIQIISSTIYGDRNYTHQGWLSTDHTHIVFGDEVDELAQYHYHGVEGFNTRTLILQVRDLSNPTNFQEYFGKTNSVDHNQYTVKATAPGQDYDSNVYHNTDLIYQANYERGMTILQVMDYDGGNLVEVGHFQTHLLVGIRPTMNGAWSTYPYFASGLVAISSAREGLYIVKPNLQDALVDPTQPTNLPTMRPTKPPTIPPTLSPTVPPTKPPTLSPTVPQTNPPTLSPTVLPTMLPTLSPTVPPTMPSPEISECEDTKTLNYKNKGRGCTWVGKQKMRLNTKQNRRRTRQRCKKRWKNKKLFTFCPTTCGRVGLGKCRKL